MGSAVILIQEPVGRPWFTSLERVHGELILNGVKGVTNIQVFLEGRAMQVPVINQVRSNNKT
jgi:hypothetical protein